MFDPTSRYYGLPTYQVTDRAGRAVAVVPATARPAQTLLGTHRLRQGQRLDHLAFHYLNDPAAYWRICEMADAMRAEQLTEQPDIPIPAPGTPS